MNLFSASCIFVFISNAVMLFLVTFKSEHRKGTIVWGFFCVAVIIWSIGGYIVSVSRDYDTALFGWKFGTVGVIFTVIFYLQFVTKYLNLNRKELIRTTYALGFIFTFFNWYRNSRYFLGGLNVNFDTFYWMDWYVYKNPLYLFFYIYFYCVLLFYSSFLLLKAYKNSKGIFRNQLKYFIIGSIVGWLGTQPIHLTFFHVNIYPFSNFLIGLYTFIFGFAILKYRLMDINIALTRAGIFAVVYLFVFGIPFLLAYKYNLWQIAIWITFVLATLGPFIYTRLRHQADARFRAEEHHAHELLRQASKGMVRYRNMKELLGLINHITSKTLKLENAAVFLVEENSGNFNLAAVRQKSKYHYLEKLNSNDALVQKLSTMEEPLVYEEVKLKAQELRSNLDDPIHEIESQMRKLSAAVIVPALSKGRLLGFLVLGEKKSKRMYSPDDLATLWALSYQAALAIENARLYEKEKIWLAEQSKRQALGEMAPGASHQFDNRLSTISATADNLIDLIKNDSQSFSKEQLIDMVSSELEVIRGEVMKGKQITEAILQRAKVKLEFDKVDIVKVIQNAINLTKLRRTRESLVGAKEPEFVFNYPEGLPQLTLCEGPIQDVFENMFNNSTDAIVIKDKRKIEPLGYQGRIAINVLPKDKSLIIQIEDNGIGIQKENLHKLFTSFFTTKATSEKGVVGGSGLGLSVMRGFVEDHGGTISVESEYTKWTRFTITLPLDFKPPKT